MGGFNLIALLHPFVHLLLALSRANNGAKNTCATRGCKMRLAVEMFGKGIDVNVSVGWGFLDLSLGRQLDVLMGDDGTRGRRWFDWASWGVHGSFEVWLGRHHVTISLGPVFAWLAPKVGTERAIPGWPAPAATTP